MNDTYITYDQRHLDFWQPCKQLFERLPRDEFNIEQLSFEKYLHCDHHKFDLIQPHVITAAIHTHDPDCLKLDTFYQPLSDLQYACPIFHYPTGHTAIVIGIFYFNYANAPFYQLSIALPRHSVEGRELELLLGQVESNQF